VTHEERARHIVVGLKLPAETIKPLVEEFRQVAAQTLEKAADFWSLKSIYRPAVTWMRAQARAEREGR
jgi:hypothetical protein